LDEGRGAADKEPDMMDERDRRNLRAGVAALVAYRFGGSSRAAFEHYDRGRDGRLDWDELTTLLADAGVAGQWSRSAWAAGVITDAGAGREAHLSWPHFVAAVGGGSDAGGDSDTALGTVPERRPGAGALDREGLR
jgi:hypothetical protein